MPGKTKKKSIHYVDNKELYAAMCEHITAYNEAREKGEDPPEVGQYIGECLLKISQGLGQRYNFVNYPFREEMEMDGIIDCLKYLHNFNPDKYKSPFSYFNRIIWQAFVRRIEKEKKMLYTKYRYYSQSGLFSPYYKEDDMSKDIHRKMEEMGDKYDNKKKEE